MAVAVVAESAVMAAVVAVSAVVTAVVAILAVVRLAVVISCCEMTGSIDHGRSGKGKKKSGGGMNGKYISLP